MTWRDRFQPGRFRNAAFLVDAHDMTFGRRTETHEFPFRNLPFAEDMGRKARELSINCYVIGADYMPGRDALIEAFETEGPGTLIHPWLGVMRVSVMPDVKLSESTAEGGMARFTVRFVESGENLQPKEAADTEAAVDAAADEATEAAEDSFADNFSVDDAPQWVSDEAQSLLEESMDAVDDAGKSFPDLKAGIADARDSLGELVQEPRDLAAQFTALIGEAAGLAPDPADALQALRKLFEFGGPSGEALAAIPQTTPSRVRQAGNQAAVLALTQRAALIEAVRASSQVDFQSYSEAVALRDELAAQVDRHLDVADDRSYVALADLKVAMVRDINARGANLARVLSIKPAATLPALVLAYRLYGDTASEEDIVARNAVRHPGFVPGGRPLEVLTRA